MLATIRDDTRDVLNMQHITQIQKDGISETSPVAVLKKIMDTPTWLKVTTLENPPPPTHIQM